MYQCPNDCGSTTFSQIVKQGETVHTTENGEPEQFEKAGEPVILEVECAECGAVVDGSDDGHRLTLYESLVRKTPVAPATDAVELVPTEDGQIEDYSDDSGGSWIECSCGETFHHPSRAWDHVRERLDNGEE